MAFCKSPIFSSRYKWSPKKFRELKSAANTGFLKFLNADILAFCPSAGFQRAFHALSLAASVTAHPCVEQMHLNSVVSGTAVQGIVSAFRKTFFMGWTIKRSRAKIWCLKSPANQGFLESLNADILRLCPVAGKILAFPVAFASPLGGTFFAVFRAVARGEERLAAGGAGFYPVALLVRLGRDFGL